jgi:thiol-disulfide isomerase/thioredoxin
MKLYLLRITAICIVLCGFFASPAGAQRKFPLPDLPGETVGALGTTDYKFSVKKIDGEKMSLSEFKGKTVFIYYWATYCGICVSSLPNIQNLWKSFRHRDDIVFLFVNKDATAEPVKKLMKERNFDFPVYLRRGTSKEFSAAGIPVAYLVNQNGEILFRHSGRAAWDHPTVLDYLNGIINGEKRQSEK